MESSPEQIKPPSATYWAVWYVVVLLVLLAEIGFFYWLTVKNN